MRLTIGVLLVSLAACRGKTESKPDELAQTKLFVAARLGAATKLSEGWLGLASRLFPSEDCSDVPIRAQVKGFMYTSARDLIKAGAMPIPLAGTLTACRTATVAAMTDIARLSTPWTQVGPGDEVSPEGVMGIKVGTKQFGEGGDPPALLAALRQFDAVTATCREAATAAGLGELAWGPTVAAAGNCALLPPP